MAMATVRWSKFYGRKGYRPQSSLNRAIGKVNTGGQVGRALGPGFFNNFPAIAAALPDALSDIVIETTESLVSRASAKAPVGETGQLRDAWQVTYRHRRTDGNVVSGRIQSIALNDDGDFYGFYVEVGTTFSRAQPFLVPALVEERPEFVARLQGLEARLPR